MTYSTDTHNFWEVAASTQNSCKPMTHAPGWEFVGAAGGTYLWAQPKKRATLERGKDGVWHLFDDEGNDLCISVKREWIFDWANGEYFIQEPSAVC